MSGVDQVMVLGIVLSARDDAIPALSAERDTHSNKDFEAHQQTSG
jgi:hypothetical protein